MAKKPSITLRITGPDGTQNETTSELESVILGSGTGAAVRLNDPKVSNLHVMLKVERGGITVIDLGSEHGTRVKDQIIKDPVSLTPGDQILIGGSKVQVSFGDANVGAPPPLPPPAVVVHAPVGANGGNGAQVHAAPPGLEPKKVEKKVPAPPRALAGTGRNAAMLFHQPLAAEATPSEDSKVLQVALLWGDTLISVQQFADGVPASIGEGKAANFSVFSPSVGEFFTLAQGKGSTAVVNVPADAGLVVNSRGDSVKSREQLKTEGKLRGAEGGVRADAFDLGLHDRAQISFENVAFIVRYVRPSAAISVNRMEEADFGFFKIASICLMAFFALVAAMISYVFPEGGLGDDIFSNPSKYAKLIIRPEKKVELKKLKDLSGIQEGKKPKDDEGKFGKKDEKKKEADPSKKGAPIVDANKREEDRKKIMKAGLLGALGDGAASNVFGPGGLGIGINNALGGLQGGAGMGDAHGVGGLGSRGAGAGGGGTGLGLGGLGTKGGGRGRGGYGSIDLGGRGKDTTRVIPGKTTVIGGLSKDVILKVIKRHQNEIKFCYEQELQKNAALAGKVAVMFTIDPAGAVAEANVSESSLGSSNTESCMLARIRRWKFPEPQGGGVVNVSFPWIFKPAGSDDTGEE